LIVNEREAQSRAMYWELKRMAPPGIPVYQQAPLQDDVWEALDGDKDDFLVYDRCGRLTFHIVLPYSFLHYPYIEAAVRATYHKDICGNCTVSEMRSIDVDNVSNPVPSDGPQMSSEGGGNMSHIHHQHHQYPHHHHQQQHQHHHNHGSDADKQDSN
uniref:Selenoprotein P N-terminal domain-containing protein n=1 Tax=Oncorhynchus kisutch TaxID=8019 RepID=A0A8C7H228_ONCKI